MLRAWLVLTCLSGGYLIAQESDSLELPSVIPIGLFPSKAEKPKAPPQKKKLVAVTEAPPETEDDPKDPYGKYSIASYSNTENKMCFFVTGSGLYWKPTEENLGYVAVANVSVFQDTVSQPQIQIVDQERKIKKPHINYHGGFEVGFGCDFPPETHWDALVNWTRYHTKASGETTSPYVDPNKLPNPQDGSYQITTLTPLLINNFNAVTGGRGSFFTFASAAWRLHIDLLDLEFGKKIFIGKWVMIRPFFGLRAERIRENYHNQYIQPPTSVVKSDLQAGVDASLGVEINAQAHMKSNYDGIGIRLGLDTQWKIYKRLSFYGDAAASALYGSEKLTAKNLIYVNSGDSLVNNTGLYKNEQNASRAVFDFDAGLRWDQMFGQDRYHLGLNIGWAYRYFINQNQFMKTSNDFGKVGSVFSNNNGGAGVVLQNNGYICLQGLVIGGQLDF